MYVYVLILLHVAACQLRHAHLVNEKREDHLVRSPITPSYQSIGQEATAPKPGDKLAHKKGDEKAYKPADTNWHIDNTTNIHQSITLQISQPNNNRDTTTTY